MHKIFWCLSLFLYVCPVLAFDPRTVIQQSMLYKKAPAFKEIDANFSNAERAYRSALASYGIRADTALAYAQTLALTDGVASHADSDSLSLTATRIMELPLGAVLEVSSLLARSNVLQDTTMQSDTIQLKLNVKYPLTSAQYLTNTRPLKTAASQFLISQISYRDSQLDLVLNNIQSYLSLLDNLNSYQSTQLSLQNNLNMLEITKYKAKLGRATQLDVITMEQQVVLARESLANTRQSMSEIMSNLNIALNLSLNIDQPIQIPTINLESFQMRPYDACAKLFDEHSAFMVSYKILSANLDESFLIDTAVDEPTFSLSSTLQQSRSGLSAPQRVWSGVLGLSWSKNLFSETRQVGLEDTREKYAYSKERLGQLLQDKYRSLQTTYDRITTLLKNDIFVEQQRHNSLQSMEIAELRFTNGQMSALDYKTYTDAHQQALADYLSKKATTMMTIFWFYKELGILEDYLADGAYAEFF